MTEYAPTAEHNEIARKWEIADSTRTLRAARMHIPLSATFELTPLCNLACKMCFVRLDQSEMDRIGRMLTAEEWLRLARETLELGTLHLLLTGGGYAAMPDVQYKVELDGAVAIHNGKRLLFLCSNPLFYCVEYTSDYTYARYYFNDSNFNIKEEQEQIDRFFFFELRKHLIAWLFCHDGLMLHSVSVFFQGTSFALSAPSETGKSTHAQLWIDHFGARIIDGDVNACRSLSGGVFIYGLPWCGKSGIYHNERAPLRAVVFLEQAPGNEVRKLPPDEAALRLTARSYLPKWDAFLMSRDYFKPAENLAATVPCYVFKCRPDLEAAEILKKCLY